MARSERAVARQAKRAAKKARAAYAVSFRNALRGLDGEVGSGLEADGADPSGRAVGRAVAGMGGRAVGRATGAGLNVSMDANASGLPMNGNAGANASGAFGNGSAGVYASGPSMNGGAGAYAGRVPIILNSGYSEGGASRTKRALKAFDANSLSPQSDIDLNNQTLRRRGRTLYMSAPIGTSAIRTNRTNVIGCGLQLRARIDRNYLHMTPEQADAWEANVEREFSLWASRKNACDATGVNDFYGLQQLALISWLMSGDVFVVVKRRDATPLCPYTLRLHLVEADRVATPNVLLGTTGAAANGNAIYDGIEVDSFGSVTAYHFRSTYPGENGTERTEWSRVPAYGEKTGLPNVLHVMDSERPDQYRGVSYLAPVIEPLLQMRRYTEGELTAAIVESFFTAFITTEADPSTNPMNEVGGEDPERSRDPNEYEMGPGQINILDPGESVTFGDPKRPASGFPAFIRAMCEQTGAALEVPADLLLKAFGQSYSASRAGLLEAWKGFKMRREWFANDFCHPVYEIWLSEAIAAGRISAPGFFTDPAIRAAYLKSDWIGPSQGQLDPTKEISAEAMAVAEGFSTREQSTVRLNGGQWDANVDQLTRENAKLAQAKAALDIGI